jgi:hypothetical protein
VSIPPGFPQDYQEFLGNCGSQQLMNRCQFLQEFLGNLGFSIFFEQVSIPPGILQECQEFLGNFGFLNIF